MVGAPPGRPPGGQGRAAEKSLGCGVASRPVPGVVTSSAPPRPADGPTAEELLVPSESVAVWWRRGLARLLDQSIAVTVLFMLVVVQIFWFMADAVDSLHPDPWGRALVPQICFVALSLVLEVVFLRWSLGQTPGRDRMKVRVVRLDDPTGQAPIGLGRALARWAVPGLAMLAPQVWPGLVIVALCGAPSLFGSGRSLPDLLAGTRVVPFDRTAHEVAVKGDDAKPRRRPRPMMRLFGVDPFDEERTRDRHDR
jgi:uncharacterized RDD family membrane protein YckC